MRKSHNEQGYALIIVLFLIVFITVVSAVFIRGSLGNAKQEIKVDESHLTVMAAEAGVDYYKSYISNFYHSLIPDLELFVQNDFNTQLNDVNNINKVIDYDKTRENVTSELEQIFNEKILELKLKNNIALYNFEVETTSVKGNPEKYIVIVTGTSIGIGQDNEKKVSFEQSFNIPDFSGSQNSSGGGINSPLDIYNLYPANVVASDCENIKNGKLKNVTCKGSNSGDYNKIEKSTVYFSNGYDKETGNLYVENSKIYGQGPFKVLNNFNQLIRSEININGNFETGNMNNIIASAFNVNGSMKINSNSKLEGSTMIVNGSAHIVGNLKVEKNSMVCVNGFLTINGQLTIGSGSKVIYRGQFINGNYNGNLMREDNESEFWEKCGKGNIINWNAPHIVNVNYE